MSAEPMHTPHARSLCSLFWKLKHVFFEFLSLACQRQNAVVQPVHMYPTWCKSFLFLPVLSFVICSFAFNHSLVCCHSLFSPNAGVCAEYDFLPLTYTKIIAIPAPLRQHCGLWIHFAVSLSASLFSQVLWSWFTSRPILPFHRMTWVEEDLKDHLVPSSLIVVVSYCFDLCVVFFVCGYWWCCIEALSLQHLPSGAALLPSGISPMWKQAAHYPSSAIAALTANK